MSGAPFRQGKRRRMNKFRILEVASVDFPAQDGATALLLKLGHPDTRRRKRKGGSRLAKSPFEDAPPGVLTDSVNGHAHLIWLHGRAGETSWSKSETHGTYETLAQQEHNQQQFHDEYRPFWTFRNE